MKQLQLPLWILVAISLLIWITLLLRGLSPLSTPTTIFEHRAVDAQSEEFYRWPIDKQVDASSVIVRGEWKREDGMYRCVIAEIIKQQPGIKFDYKVGDEFPPGNQRAKPHTNYGDGQLIFFTGSPPTLQFIIAISGERLIGGDVSLDTIRAMVDSEASKPPASAQ